MTDQEVTGILELFGEWCLSNDIKQENGNNPVWYQISYSKKVEYFVRWRNTSGWPVSVTEASIILKQ